MPSSGAKGLMSIATVVTTTGISILAGVVFGSVLA